MGKIKEFRSSPPRIIGSTTINHEIRVKLGLNCSEYCMLDHLSRKEDKGELADTLSVYIHTGFEEVAQEAILKGLIIKSMVAITSGIDGKNQDIIVSKKWYDAFPDLDKEFDQFWFELIPNKLNPTQKIRQIAWTGTKKKAIEYWHKLRKKYSFEYLMAQRTAYFEYLELEHKRGFARQRMMCQVFLNPGSERYAEDYADYANQLRIKLGLAKPEEQTNQPLTMDKLKEAYGKDNHQ